MTPSQPYLLRALNEWLVDNGMTPQILVDTRCPGVEIPATVKAEDHRLVLNISPGAVRDLLIENDYLSFVARFSGVSRGVLIPVAAVRAIYARENGQGMMFPETPDETGPVPAPERHSTTPRPPAEKPNRTGGKPDLKVIK